MLKWYPCHILKAYSVCIQAQPHRPYMTLRLKLCTALRLIPANQAKYNWQNVALHCTKSFGTDLGVTDLETRKLMGGCGKLLNDVQPEYKEKHAIVFSITESLYIYLIISFNCLCSASTSLSPFSQSIHWSSSRCQTYPLIPNVSQITGWYSKNIELFSIRAVFYTMSFKILERWIWELKAHRQVYI